MIRTPARRPLLVLALGPVLGLAACHGGDGGQKAAAGEVLSGSVSDAMLPLDTVTSQPPRAAGHDSAAAPDAAASDAATGAEAGTPAAPADPAASPTG